MRKYIKDGKVAILYSPKYGSGWSSWNTQYPELLFDPDIVQFVLDHPDMNKKNQDFSFMKNDDEFTSLLQSRYPDAYFGGWRNLNIEWMSPGTQFRIIEYDGYESIEYNDGVIWEIA